MRIFSFEASESRTPSAPPPNPKENAEQQVNINKDTMETLSSAQVHKPADNGPFLPQVAPKLSTPRPNRQPIVTKEEADRVRNYILELLLNHLPEEALGKKWIKCILPHYLFVGTDHSLALRLTNSNFNKITPGPFNKSPDILKILVNIINQQFGENTAMMGYGYSIAEIAAHGDEGYDDKNSTFSISAENVKRIHDNLPRLMQIPSYSHY